MKKSGTIDIKHSKLTLVIEHTVSRVEKFGIGIKLGRYIVSSLLPYRLLEHGSDAISKKFTNGNKFKSLHRE